MNKTKKSIKYLGLLALVCLLMVSAYSAFAGSSLLSASGSQVKAGEGFKVKLSIDDLKDEYNEGGQSFSVKVTISPAIESVSVSPDVNVHQYGTSFTLNSADLQDVSAVNFTFYPGNVTAETSYTVTASVAGQLSTPSDSVTFTAIPSQDNTDPTDPADPANPTVPGGNLPSGKPSSGSFSMSGGSSSTVVYEGSWDNYLESLSVSGYEFTQTFNKTRDTYFVNVPESVKTLEVKAKASDSSATVRVTGQDTISAENSKILISVTADNGDVRTYRIFVKHQTEESDD